MSQQRTLKALGASVSRTVEQSGDPHFWYHRADLIGLFSRFAQLLRQAVRQAPLERKWAILHKKLVTLEAFKEERDTGWSIAQKIADVKHDTIAASS